jgi:hypothetical protein
MAMTASIAVSPQQCEEVGAEHGKELEPAGLRVHRLEEARVPRLEGVAEPPLHPVERRRGPLLPLLRLFPARRRRGGGEAHVLAHEVADARAGHVVLGGEGAEDLAAAAMVEGAVPVGEAVERRGGRGGGRGGRVEPVADGGGGVGVGGRRRGRLRGRGGERVRMHAGAEEDGERLRGVAPGHVTVQGNRRRLGAEAAFGRGQGQLGGRFGSAVRCQPSSTLCLPSKQRSVWTLYMV